MDEISDGGHSSQGLIEQEEPGNDAVTSEQMDVPTDDDTLLVEIVATYPALYNKQLKEYKNSVIRETCWEQISIILHRSAPECLKRWNQLRESYSREKRRREDECRSGSGPTKRKGFHLYNTMAFLEQHIQRRKAFTNVASTSYAIPNNTSSANNTPNYPKRVCLSQPIQVSMPCTATPAMTFRIPMPPPSLTTPPSFSPISPVNIPAQTLHFSPPTASPSLTLPENYLPKPAAMSPAESSRSILTPSPPLTVTQNSLQKSAAMSPAESSCSIATPSPPLTVPENYFQKSAAMLPIESSRSLSTPSPPLPVSENYLQKLTAMSPAESSRSILTPSSPGTPTPPPRISEAQFSGPLTPSPTSWMRNNNKENVQMSASNARPKFCYTKETGKSKNVDPIEASFLNLSATLQTHFQNSGLKKEARKTAATEQCFANFIANELEQIPEPLKTSKKARIIQILYEKEG